MKPQQFNPHDSYQCLSMSIYIHLCIYIYICALWNVCIYFKNGRPRNAIYKYIYIYTYYIILYLYMHIWRSQPMSIGGVLKCRLPQIIYVNIVMSCFLHFSESPLKIMHLGPLTEINGFITPITKLISHYKPTYTNWWFQPLWKYISQLGVLFPIYGKISYSKPPTRSESPTHETSGITVKGHNLCPYI